MSQRPWRIAKLGLIGAIAVSIAAYVGFGGPMAAFVCTGLGAWALVLIGALQILVALSGSDIVEVRLPGFGMSRSRRETKEGRVLSLNRAAVGVGLIAIGLFLNYWPIAIYFGLWPFNP